MTEYKGIDVSEYQGNIDWSRVRADGYTFAMLRCGYGRFEGQEDRKFEQNYTQCKKHGIYVGAYLFSYALTVEQAREEAEHCLSIIKGKRFEYPICYDVETAAQQKLGKEKLSEIVETFCGILEENGYYVSVYTSLSFLRTAMSKEIPEKYDIWLAQWASKPTYEGKFGMWQHSATGNVNGIIGSVDLDISYKNYPAIMQEKGLNGFLSPVPSPTKPLYAGKEVYLEQSKIFSSSTTRFHSAKLSGTYYLYDAIPINGRYRITNRAGKAAKKPIWLYVTGWVEAKEIGA